MHVYNFNLINTGKQNMNNQVVQKPVMKNGGAKKELKDQ